MRRAKRVTIAAPRGKEDRNANCYRCIRDRDTGIGVADNFDEQYGEWSVEDHLEDRVDSEQYVTYSLSPRAKPVHIRTCHDVFALDPSRKKEVYHCDTSGEPYQNRTLAKAALVRLECPR